MRAMVLTALGRLQDNPTPLQLTDLPDPIASDDELLLQVSACGVCHTELDEIEGRTPPPRLPVVLGHQVIGRVVAAGSRVDGFQPGDRVGVAWIYSACGNCPACLAGNENLCPDFRATGRDANGGYAELMTVPAAFAYPIPAVFSDVEAAPLLCAGAIGYRSLRLAGLQRRPTSRADRVWRLGAPGSDDGPPSLSQLARFRLCAQRGGARLCARVGRSLDRRHRRGGAGEACSDRRHDARVEAGGRGAQKPGARRPVGDQRHPQGGDRQGRAASPGLPDPISGWRKKSKASPTWRDAMCKNSWRWQPKSRSGPRSSCIRWKRLTRLWST